ncbi:MAG: hypothetical protein ACOX0E_03610 [Syntrophomonadaceae bacterium]|jgi:cell division protein FtsB
MYKLFIIFISSVFAITLIFGFLFYRQTVKIEKKALAAKKKRDEYIARQLELQKAARDLPDGESDATEN